ncbi:DUF721 domain-containing protein [Tropicibacter naphthalenivorans]|uniref:Zn-ribbon-containing, possibly RNA-binding protein and truncated derivatives n=1 Tax=Tropicibacter naphthalenivorans TaxID=441103 RepID=A0A0P1GTF3_9RHOB|nr:DciA family protein [Tropicibacter naphthalenivorans]CUH78452.1 Zn-ribbon-containing, possibly RNA-binding protein and truncated derivatives [Tropicibacter naphthalenivorans]SMC80526.1 hypothetical protein SAMN04488093_104146 [Tropicibacter naphthalenivorans]
MSKRSTSTYGFKPTSKFLESKIRNASESRGFSQSRVLTHWDEIAGPDIAAMTRPVEVSYGRGGFGATLALLTTGANAPLVQMRAEEIRAKINAVYGYNAITRVRVTQTAATGFAEGQVDFQHRKKPQTAEPPAEVKARAAEVADGVGDPALRAALERLATNVITKGNRG